MSTNRKLLVYLDSNIYSLAVNDPSMMGGLRHLVRSGHVYVMSETVLGELHLAGRKHEGISILLDELPVYLFKSHAALVQNAIASYPNDSGFDPLMPERLTGTLFLDLIVHPKVAASSTSLKTHAGDVPERYLALKSNFPPAQDGLYSKDQLNQFVGKFTLQWLEDLNPSFVAHKVAGNLSLEPFQTIMSHASLVFWKFYLGRRTPNPSSDLGDQAHARFYPLCGTVVVEKDTAACLRQMKGSGTFAEALFADVNVMTVKDVRALARP